MEVNGDLPGESLKLADLVAPGAPISWNQQDFMCCHSAALAKQQPVIGRKLCCVMLYLYYAMDCLDMLEIAFVG